LNNCLSCNYWNAINPELGECRRRAPIIRNIEDGKGTSFWPYTSKTDGCGDFESKIYLNEEDEDESN